MNRWWTTISRRAKRCPGTRQTFRRWPHQLLVESKIRATINFLETKLKNNCKWKFSVTNSIHLESKYHCITGVRKPGNNCRRRARGRRQPMCRWAPTNWTFKCKHAVQGSGDVEERGQGGDDQGHHGLGGQHAWRTGCKKSTVKTHPLFFLQFIAKEELEKNERTRMKQLTLEINERQEEEELQVWEKEKLV